MESSIPTFQYFFRFFFIWSVNCLSHFFRHVLLVSKLYELNLWFQRCPEAYALIYIWDLLVLLFMESWICTIFAYSDFFLVGKLYNIGLQIMPLFQTILNWCPVLILEIFICWDIKKGQFQFLVTFLAVFFWSVNCTNHHIFWTWGMFYLRVFGILAFLVS